MMRVLFTVKRGQPLHKLWRNFLLTPPKGIAYVDCEGKGTDLFGGKQGSTDSAMMFLYNLKKKSAFLVYHYKMYEERMLSQRIDKVEADLIYCVNGRLYHGERPWVVDFENPSVFFGYNLAAMKRYKRQVKNILLRENCKSIIAYSNTGKESFLRIFGDDLKEKIRVVPNCIMMPRQRMRIRHEGVNLLFTGSVNIDDNFYARGGRELVHAFAKICGRYPEACLIMRCGIPEEERRLLEGKNVKIYKETLDNEQFTRLFLESDIYVLPAYIGYALSTLEAMSYGLPVITSDLLENGENVKDGVTGLTIRPPQISYPQPLIPDYYFKEKYRFNLDKRYVGKIAQAMERLISDKRLREHMGRKASKIATKHTVHEKNELLRKIYMTAIER